MANLNLTIEDLLKGYDHCYLEVHKKRKTKISNPEFEILINILYNDLAQYIAEIFNRKLIGFNTREAIVDELKKHTVPFENRLERIIKRILYIRYPVDRESVYNKIYGTNILRETELTRRRPV